MADLIIVYKTPLSAVIQHKHQIKKSFSHWFSISPVRHSTGLNTHGVMGLLQLNSNGTFTQLSSTTSKINSQPQYLLIFQNGPLSTVQCSPVRCDGSWLVDLTLWSSSLIHRNLLLYSVFFFLTLPYALEFTAGVVNVEKTASSGLSHSFSLSLTTYSTKLHLLLVFPILTLSTDSN